jgi:Fe2+ or Zn2+ uptake regulation protein
MLSEKTEYIKSLQSKGLRATSQRLELLQILTEAGKPMGIAELQELSKGEVMDTATFYRGLETFTEAGLVRKVNLRHGHMDYEITHEGDHHHHVVCQKCGEIESFDWCPDNTLRNQILKNTSFSSIDDHALEFFGLCKKCA